MSRRHLTDGELLVRTARGDADAFSELYERHEPIVAAFLQRRTGDPELTADLTAETFSAAIVSARRFQDRDGASAAGWLLGIAGNLLARSRQRSRIEDRARRRLGVRSADLSEESYERVEALIDDAAPGNALRQALERLPAEQQAAIRAHVLDERSYRDIATTLGVPEATVRQRVSRGLTRLRTTIEGRTP